MGVPAATPAPVVARANEALNKVLRDEGTKTRLARLGHAAWQHAAGIPRLPAQQISVLSSRAREAGLEQQ